VRTKKSENYFYKWHANKDHIQHQNKPKKKGYKLIENVPKGSSKRYKNKAIHGQIASHTFSAANLLNFAFNQY